MNVTVHIDRLVLDGVPLEAGRQHLLAAAIGAELARLIAAGGLAPELAAGTAVPRLAGGPLALPEHAHGTQGGSQDGAGIAASIYAAIGKAGS